MSKSNDYFPMELPSSSDEVAIVQSILAIVIDARLTAFTQSEFHWCVHLFNGQVVPVQSYSNEMGDGFAKLHCNIHPDDMEVLIRRLDEYSEDDNNPEELMYEANSLVWDIVRIYYGLDEEDML